jgi:hypothetical protein
MAAHQSYCLPHRRLDIAAVCPPPPFAASPPPPRFVFPAQASVSGNLTVSFYDAEAGWGALGPALLPARTNPQMLSVKVDASNLPQRYTRVSQWVVSGWGTCCAGT